MTKNISNNAQKLFLKGSEAIARTVANCQPRVIAAYPITPQTGIIEELVPIFLLSKLKANIQPYR